jgi:hypothetical protein
MLSEQQKNIIIETLKPFNPVYIGLFGSYARNEERENSDIDILYELKATYTLFDLMDLQNTLQTKLNKKVDLVSKKYINKHLKPYVEHDIKILFNA